VVLMHGISLCAGHWAGIMGPLGPLRCIALDMPGHGRSDAVDFRGVDLRRWHTEMLRGCLDRLGLDSAHFIGHSYGAMFALWLALESPERVRSIVGIGAPSVSFGARPDITFRTLARPLIGPLSLSLPSPLFAFRRVLAMSLGRRAIDNAPEELIRATYLGTRRAGFARTVSSYLRQQFLEGCVFGDDELKRVEPPVLMVWGNEDHRFQPIAEGRAKTALMPHARFELVQGGHEPWLDALDGCGRAVGGFLS
jgi:pimeloyl-ACP methyl ester carboxylesterase